MENKGIVSTLFEKKIKPVLLYVGTIGAVLSAIAYVIIILTMIFGLTVEASIQDTIIFACVNAVIGFVIMQFLKVQGITFAKNLPANQEITQKWREMNPPKDKKKHSLKYFWFSSVVKDVVTRVLLIVITTICIIYLVIRGTHDYTYLLLMVVNLLMFACFGLISLVNAHDFYIEQHIPYLEEQINETTKKQEAAREEAIKAEVERRLALDKEEHPRKRDVIICPDCGTNLLEPSDSFGYTCPDCGPMVLVSGSRLHSVLGCTNYTGMDDSNCGDARAEESPRENKTTEAKEE